MTLAPKRDRHRHPAGTGRARKEGSRILFVAAWGRGAVMGLAASRLALGASLRESWPGGPRATWASKNPAQRWLAGREGDGAALAREAEPEPDKDREERREAADEEPEGHAKEQPDRVDGGLGSVTNLLNAVLDFHGVPPFAAASAVSLRN